jgi:hypothetical protein
MGTNQNLDQISEDDNEIYDSQTAAQIKSKLSKAA